MFFFFFFVGTESKPAHYLMIFIFCFLFFYLIIFLVEKMFVVRTERKCGKRNTNLENYQRIFRFNLFCCFTSSADRSRLRGERSPSQMHTEYMYIFKRQWNQVHSVRRSTMAYGPHEIHIFCFARANWCVCWHAINFNKIRVCDDITAREIGDFRFEWNERSIRDGRGEQAKGLNTLLI